MLYPFTNTRMDIEDGLHKFILFLGRLQLKFNH